MPTLYRVHHPTDDEVPFGTTDADRAERLSRAGLRVTATTAGGKA